MNIDEHAPRGLPKGIDFGLVIEAGEEAERLRTTAARGVEAAEAAEQVATAAEALLTNPDDQELWTTLFHAVERWRSIPAMPEPVTRADPPSSGARFVDPD